ncbi:MAG: hypothetical protein K2P34_01590 [Lachnospiraceae bacterium]|nr:hypothetical protein [Lachnospiraceae bacterium]
MKEHLIEQVVKIMRQIDDTKILTKIYITAKTHLEILQEKEGVADE